MVGIIFVSFSSVNIFTTFSPEEQVTIDHALKNALNSIEQYRAIKSIPTKDPIKIEINYNDNNDTKVVTLRNFTDDDGYFTVLGELQNLSPNTISADTTVTFYDKTAKVLDVSDSYLHGTLKPGEKGIFIVYSDRPEAINHYKIDVFSRVVGDKPTVLQIKQDNGYIDSTGWYTIVGEITNNGDSPATLTKVIASFYNKAGEPIGEGFTYVYRDILQKQTVPFELTTLDSDMSRRVHTYILDVESEECSLSP